MKRIIILFCMLAITFSALSMKKGHGRGMQHNCILVISSDHDMFYFKSDREVNGAVIEVFEYKTDEKVISGAIDSRKTVVDFTELKSGDYIIMITKGEFRRKYVFRKK